MSFRFGRSRGSHLLCSSRGAIIAAVGAAGASGIMAGPPTLEEVLMRRYSVKYVSARRLVDDARRTLGMSRIEPWTEELQQECEKRLNADADFIKTSAVPSPSSRTSKFVSHFRSSVIVDTIPEDPSAEGGATKEMPKSPVPSWYSHKSSTATTSRAWQAHANTSRRVIVKRVPLKQDPPSSCKVVALMTGVTPSKKRFPVESAIVENTDRTLDEGEDTDDSSGGHGIEVMAVEKTNVTPIGVPPPPQPPKKTVAAAATTTMVQMRTGVDVDMMMDEEKTEAEMIADDCSQATDNSKCFTTAKELGIEDDDSVLAVDPEMPSHAHHLNEAKQPLLDKVPSSSNHVHNEESTTGTSSVSEVGVPLIILLRFDLPPEVPDDEPLAQCYNLALPVYTRRQRLRASILNQWRRFTGFKPRQKVRLTDDDTEMRIQTLVDL